VRDDAPLVAGGAATVERRTGAAPLAAVGFEAVVALLLPTPRPVVPVTGALLTDGAAADLVEDVVTGLSGTLALDCFDSAAGAAFEEAADATGLTAVVAPA
jgi:hypothetical protein